MQLTEILSPSAVLVFVVVFLFCYRLFSKSDLPPGPVKLPFIGSAWLFIFANFKKEKTSTNLARNRKKYGDVTHMRLGGYDVIFISGYDAIHEAFVKRSEDFSSRPTWLMPDHMKALGSAIVFGNGAKWKRIRKFSIVALRDFGVGKTSLENKIMQEVDATTDYFTENKGTAIETSLLTSMLITNVIYQIVFGQRMDYKSALMKETLDNMNTLFKAGSPLAFTSLIPRFIWKILGDKNRYTARDRQKVAIAYVTRHIDMRIAEHQETYDPDTTRDFVDLFLQKENQYEDGKENDAFTLSHLYGVILDLFLAGSETTSNSLNWCILYMQEYPEVQARCQREIRDICGDRVITWSDRGTLPFTEATLLEVQRLSNIAPMSLPHTNTEEVTFRGYRIPANSIIHGNLTSANLDPDYWDEPTVFKPERHMVDGKLTKNPAFIPFSIGPRMCAGEMLAKMELFLVVTNLLQRFTFHREHEHLKHSFNRLDGQITSAPQPYQTRAMRRID